MNCAIAHGTGPIAFLSFGSASDTECGCTGRIHYGRGMNYIPRLIRELGRATDVVTIDVCGGGAEFRRMKHPAMQHPAMKHPAMKHPAMQHPAMTHPPMGLRNTGVNSLPLFPEQPYMTTLSGVVELPDLVKGTLSIPNIGEAVSRLRRALHEVQPRAVCVEDEQALFVAWLAIPPDLPLIYLVTSDLHSIQSYCAPAWCRVNAALGVSWYSLRYLNTTQYAHHNLHVVGSGIDVDRVLVQVGAQMGAFPRLTLPVDGGQRLGCSAEQGSRSAALSVVSPISFPRPLKGHQVGMQAIADLNRMGMPAELWLCGSERESSAGIAGLAAELGVQEHVRVLGRRLSRPSTVAQSDVALLLSCTRDSHQLILEAMALAKPVVAARAGSAPELVRDGIDGILVEPGDVGATVAALRRLGDPMLRRRMGATGQRRARNEFSPGRQVDRFLGAIDAMDEPNRLTRDWLFN